MNRQEYVTLEGDILFFERELHIFLRENFVTRSELINIALYFERQNVNDSKGIIEELLLMGFKGFDNMDWDELCAHVSMYPRAEIEETVENWL